MGFSDIFQHEAKDPSIQFAPEFPETKFARGWTRDLLAKGIPNIPLRSVAGMTPTEELGQQKLSEFANAGAPRPYTMGLSELEKTIDNQYDPRTSDLYKGFREQSMLEEEDAANKLRRAMQIQGMGSSSPSIAEEGKLRSRFATDRQSMLGNLVEQERMRKYGAIPQLLAYGDYEREMPQQVLQAIANYGGLPREIQQMMEDAIYGRQYETTMFPYTGQFPLAATLMSQRPELYIDQGHPAEDKEWWKWTKLGLGVLGGMPGASGGGGWTTTGGGRTTGTYKGSYQNVLLK